MPKVILVAGASSSFGLSLCKQLAQKKYLVYAGYRSNRISKNNLPSNIIPIKLDITDDRSCQNMIKKIIKTNKKIYAVINLVGISPSGPGIDFSSTDFQTILDTNTIGAFRLAKTVFPYLADNGRVINIGSLCSVVSFPNFSLYCASKFALRAMSLSLYHEWAPKKRYVVCISPGAIADNKPSKSFQRSARQSIPILKLLFPLITQEQVVANIIETTATSHPQADVLIGRDTQILSILNKFMPSSVWNLLQSYIWQKQQRN